MRIEDRYREIGEKFERCVQDGKIVTDSKILAPEQDTRRGLSLIFRPTGVIADAVAKLQTALGKYGPPQYAQPASDLHTTVLSVIPGLEDYSGLSMNRQAYCNAVARSVERISPEIVIRYRGVVASDDSVIVKGYPEGSDLQMLRTKIISELDDSGLENPLTRRYETITAHMTIVRFVDQFDDINAFARGVSRFANIDLGTLHVRNLKLVENDWYMRKENLDIVNDISARNRTVN